MAEPSWSVADAPLPMSTPCDASHELSVSRPLVTSALIWPDCWTTPETTSQIEPTTTAVSPSSTSSAPPERGTPRAPIRSTSGREQGPEHDGDDQRHDEARDLGEQPQHGDGEREHPHEQPRAQPPPHQARGRGRRPPGSVAVHSRTTHLFHGVRRGSPSTWRHRRARGSPQRGAGPSPGGQTDRVAVIDAFGARWTFDVSGLDDHLADRLLHLWDRALVEPDGDAAPTALRGPPHRRRGGSRSTAWSRPTDDRDVPYLVSRCLTIASIRRRSGSCVMLHAAGLATDDGGTVALVAGSGTGKTTAGRLLGRSLGYVSDETVTVEHDLTVRPYPKPLSIVTDPTVPTRQARGVTRRPRAAPGGAGAAAVGRRRARTARRRRRAGPGADRAGRGDEPGAAAVLGPAQRRPPARPAGAGARHRARAVPAHLPQHRGLRRPRHRPRPRRARPRHRRRHLDVVRRARPRRRRDTGARRPRAVDRGGPHRFGDAVLSDGVVLLLRDWVPITLPGLAASVWLAADRPVAVSDLRRRRRGRARPPPRRRGDRRRHRADDDRARGRCTSCDAGGARVTRG